MSCPFTDKELDEIIDKGINEARKDLENIEKFNNELTDLVSKYNDILDLEVILNELKSYIELLSSSMYEYGEITEEDLKEIRKFYKF